MKRRRAIFVRREEVVAVATTLEESGERFRLNVSWNGSFHDASFEPVFLVGPAVRQPHTAADACRIMDEAYGACCQAFDFSRRG